MTILNKTYEHKNTNKVKFELHTLQLKLTLKSEHKNKKLTDSRVFLNSNF